MKHNTLLHRAEAQSTNHTQTSSNHVHIDFTQSSSHLGWILSGRISENTSMEGQMSSHGSQVNVDNIVYSHMMNIDEPVDDILRKFWEIEEIGTRPIYSNDEKKCEEHFMTTHVRGEDGNTL